RLITTLCEVTSSQQAAARELAQEVDLVLVVGGRSSANTRHLLDVCKEEGTLTHHVEGPDGLQAEGVNGWRGARGRVAGSVTPGLRRRVRSPAGPASGRRDGRRRQPRMIPPGA